MSQALLSSACSSLTRQEKSKAQAWFELVTSLKIVFMLELMGKSKARAWLGLA